MRESKEGNLSGEVLFITISLLDQRGGEDRRRGERTREEERTEGEERGTERITGDHMLIGFPTHLLLHTHTVLASVGMLACIHPGTHKQMCTTRVHTCTLTPIETHITLLPLSVSFVSTHTHTSKNTHNFTSVVFYLK